MKKKENKISKKLARQWVKALRSGEYKQGVDDLCSISLEGKEQTAEYCCLGVLCEVENGEDFWIKSDRYSSRLRPRGSDSTSYYGNHILSDDLVDKLVNMNDSGDSFKKIASYIEKKLRLK